MTCSRLFSAFFSLLLLLQASPFFAASALQRKNLEFPKVLVILLAESDRLVQLTQSNSADSSGSVCEVQSRGLPESLSALCFIEPKAQYYLHLLDFGLSRGTAEIELTIFERVELLHSLFPLNTKDTMDLKLIFEKIS